MSLAFEIVGFVIGSDMEKEKVRIDAQAAGLAAYDLVQKIFLLLIERRALSVADAQVILAI